MPNSCLYVGQVMHKRLRPREHRFSYSVFWMMLDLAEIEALAQKLRLFSVNKFNLLSFHARDHGDASGKDLRAQIDARLADHGVDLRGGPVRLLTMPRVLGFVFNPISIYYCHHADGRLMAMVYEVTSTFRERYFYVIPVSAGNQRDGVIMQLATKALHVSPFMEMDMSYRFLGRVPAEKMVMSIMGNALDGPVIATSMSGTRKPMTERTLLGVAFTFPLSTIKVVAGIHWEALRLFLKRIKLRANTSETPGVLSLRR